jgi:uncharacterized membrane protein
LTGARFSDILPEQGSATMAYASPWRGPTNRRDDCFRIGVVLAIAGVLLGWIPAVLHRSFDADELEHCHAAFCVWHGMLPYRDFFEHHTPWYYYALGPLFHGFDVAGSVEAARRFLLVGRGLSLALTALSVLLVVRMGRLWQNRVTGLVAGLLLVSQPVFFEKSIEMRPDVLALPLLLGCLWLLLRGLARTLHGRTTGLPQCFGGGVCLGAAIMCTQKMLFVLPGALAGLVVGALAVQRKARIRNGVLWLLAFLAGVGVPTALTWGAFALRGSGGEFITNNFLLNAKWQHIDTHQLPHLLSTSWPIVVLSLAGAVLSLGRSIRSPGTQAGGLLLLCTLVGLAVGAFVIPSAHGQYFLMPLPLACLLAAQALAFLVERVERRFRALLFVVALVPLAVLPALALRNSLRIRNDGQLAGLRFVFETTRPGDVVMDGWQGMGVFRPHAFYYFFLHQETLAMLPRARLAAYLDALEKGEIRPALIALDRNLVALGPRFVDFVKQHYVSSDGFFYVRNGYPRSGFGPPRPGDLLRKVWGL